MANVKATDLIDFTRASKGHALAKVSYGSEEVVNGTFDTDSDWTTQRVSIASGVADFSDNSSGPARIIQDNVYTVGKTYLVTFDVNTSGTLRVYDGSGYDGDISVSSGTVSKIIYAEGTQFIIRANVTNDYTGTIDNVSVKEVLFNQPDGSLQLFEHPNNIPRIEYDADGNLLGLLIEEARTNLVVYSEDFSQWNGLSQMLPFGSGSTVNATTAPNGTLTADLLVPNTTNSNSHFVRDIASVTVGNDYTFSVYVKAAGYTTCSLRLYGTDAPITNFDLSAETTDQSAATITNVGGGWYRCTLTGEATSTGSWYYVYPNQQATFTGDGTSGIYVWGAQVEVGSFATSYIKNEGTSSGKARSADVASIDVDQFGYNQSEGTLFAEAQMFIKDVSYKAIANLNTNGSNRIRMISSSSVNVIQAEITNGGTTQMSISESIPEGSLFSGAVAYKQNDSCSSVNGSVETTDTSCTIPAVTKLDIMTSNSGHIKSITYTPKRLSNAKLQELTK